MNKSYSNNIMLTLAWTLCFYFLPIDSSQAAIDNEADHLKNHHSTNKKGKARAIYNSQSFYLDGVNGNDGHDGRSEQRAVKTVARLLSLNIKSNDTIFIARGSTFREFLNIKGKGIDHITIKAYGSGNRPVFDAADTAANTLFSKTTGWNNIYEISWTNQFRDRTDMSQYSVWEDGWRLTRVNSMEDLDKTPGSFFASTVSQPMGTDLIRVHSRNSDAVNSNNRLYEITSRSMGIHVGDHSRVYNMHTRRNGSNNGSFECGHDSYIYGVLAEDGVKHNFFMASGTAENCTVWKSDNPAVFGGNSLFISFTTSPHADTMDLEYKDCQVIAGRNTTDQAQYGAIGIYAHSTASKYRSLHVSGGVFANTSVAVSAEINDIFVDSAFFINNFSATARSRGNLTFRNNRIILANYESAQAVGGDNKPDSILFSNNKVYMTASNQKCMIFIGDAPSYCRFTDNTLFSSNEGNTILIYYSHGGGKLRMKRNLAANAGNGSIVPFITMDFFSKTDIQADSNHYAVELSPGSSSRIAWQSINSTLNDIREVKAAGFEKNSYQEQVQHLMNRIYGVYGTTDFFLPKSDVLFGKQGSSNTFDGQNRYPYRLGDTLSVKIKDNNRFTKIFDFSATRAGGVNVLHWTIGGSDNILDYKIKHSTDSINFSDIGSVQHKKGKKSYSFTHEQPEREKNYYSLIAMEDNNSKIKSDTVLLFNQVQDSIYSLSAYPNPVEGILHLSLNSQEAGKISIGITGMDGKNVLQVQQPIMHGNQIIDLNLHTLRPGVYNMQVILNQEKKIIRIFKR